MNSEAFIDSIKVFEEVELMRLAIGHDEICSKLKLIFFERFGIKEDFWDDVMMNKHLLGSDIGMAPRDLIYLLYDIEERFSLNIPQDYIASGGLSSFTKIVEVLEKIEEEYERQDKRVSV